MLRRKILGLVAGSPLLALFTSTAGAAPTPADIEAMQKDWRALLPEGADIAEQATPLDKAPRDWLNELPRSAWKVLFEEDTERPFTSPLNEEKRDGVYVCAACRLPLFTSAMKYDSGTGWPSFITAIPGHLDTKTDWKLVWPRTEYHCVRCGGHQGHVFDDGPPPTNERWCNNGLALDFLPAD